MAAATTLALSVICVAARAKRACSACAFSDSTVRRLRPKTSGIYDTLTCGRKQTEGKLVGVGRRRQCDWSLAARGETSRDTGEIRRPLNQDVLPGNR